MKRIKGILAITISFVILFASIPTMPVFAETYSGSCGTNVTWSLDTESGVLTISGSGSMNNYDSAPWYSQRGNIKSVNIENGVKSIGSYAFDECRSLTSVTIPDSVTSIGSYAFDGCSSLKSITIPDGVTIIGERAFRGCSSLISINVDDGNENYSSQDGVLFNKDKTELICCPGSKSGGYVIPDSVTSIDYAAFYGCSSLTSITIPFVGATKDGTSDTHFGYIFGASSYSDNSSYVPKSLKTVEITGGISIGSCAFYNCSSLTSVTIPDSVTRISDNAFRGCSSVKSVTIGNGVTSIGSGAFSRCSSLTSITIPFVGATKDGTSNTHFGYIFGASSYSDNSSYVPESLKTVEITGGTSIGERAFYNCSGLTSITIPDSVTSIGEYAFYNCQDLKTVYNLSALPIVKGNSSYGYVAYYADAVYTCDLYGGLSLLFSKDNGLLKISGSGEMPNFNLFSSTPWYEYADQIKAVEIDESITKVGTYSFYGLANLKELATGNKDLQFGMYAINPSVDFKIYSLSGGTLENYCKTNNIDFEPPITAPELASVTSNSITVKAVNGFEYSKNGTAWQSSNIFTGLNAVTEYSIYTRRKGMLTDLASAASPALKVKTFKNTAAAPVNPFVIDVDESTVTLKPIEGYEYSKDGVNWQTSNVFTELDKNVIYNFYQRRAETYDTFASANSDAARATVVANPTIVFVGATTLKVSKTEGFEYSLDKITWQTSDTFTMLIPELNYTVYQRPTNTLVYYVIGEGTTVNINGKDMAATPEEPTLLNKSATTVTLTAVAGCEYKMDNGNWQDSNVFENLSPFTEYTFYQGVKETDTSAASESSVGLKVITDKAYTLGDVNCNGTVDIIDLQRLYAHLNGSNPLGESLSYGDVNGNGTVDIIDLQRLYAHLNGSNLLF